MQPKILGLHPFGVFEDYIITMKKYLSTFILLSTVSFVALAQSGRSKTGGSIQFIEDKFNFGEVKEEGGPVSHVFAFKNTGKGPLRIVNVLTSCGCTTSDWTQTAVNPGESGYVKATFDPKNRPGRFSRILTIVTNGIPESAVITLEGQVGSANREMLRMFPHEIGKMRFTAKEFDVTVKEDKTDSVWLGVYNPTTKNMFIRTAVSPLPMKVDVQNMLLGPESGDNILMLYNGALAKHLGPRRDTVYFVTSDDTLPNKYVVLKVNVVQNFDKLTPAQRLNAPVIDIPNKLAKMGELYLGETGTATVEVVNKGKSDLVIRRLMGSDASVTAKVSNTVIKKGAKAKITLSFNSKGAHGSVDKSLTVISNDPTNPNTVIKVSAKVVIPGIEPIGN